MGLSRISRRISTVPRRISPAYPSPTVFPLSGNTGARPGNAGAPLAIAPVISLTAELDRLDEMRELTALDLEARAYRELLDMQMGVE